MPPLQLFGRLWRISSDDFVCPAVSEFFVRLSWIIILIFVLVFHIQEVNNLECLGAEYQLTTYYLSINIGLLVITCIVNLSLAYHSSRGRIVETGPGDPRRCVTPLLYTNIVLTLLEFFWTVVGAYFTIKDFMRCIDQEHERTVIVAVLVIIALFWLLLILKIFLVVCSFRPYSRVRSDEERSLLGSHERRSRQEARLNYFGLRCIAPCTNDEQTINAFRDIANLLSKIFADTSLVPSDIVAGLIILSHAPHKTSDDDEGVVTRTVFDNMGVSLIQVESENSENVGLEVAGEDSRIRLDWDLIKHYYKFAAAAYGYMWWMLQSPVANCCKLGHYLQCSSCCRASSEEMFVEGDGMFKPNYAAIRAMLDVEDRDIVAFDNRNMVEEVPFLMVADKVTKSLVISIRGTLSLHDMLTDLRGEPGQILEDSRAEWTGHQGMVNAARYVFNRLHGRETERDSRTSGAGQSRHKDILKCCLLDPEYSGYDIVVTGHSLGAGTATILAFLLRESYPDTRVSCYAFSPPGGLLSLAAAEESERFTVSVVVGDDVIPRLSLINLGVLSRDIKSAITRCQLPKYQVFGYGCLACCCKRPNNPLMVELERLYLSSEHQLLDQSTAELISNTVSTSPPVRPAQPLLSMPAMFLPGRIIHIRETRDESGVRYKILEQRREVFNQILVSASMLNDHLPNNLDKVLNSCPDNLQLIPILL